MSADRPTAQPAPERVEPATGEDAEPVRSGSGGGAPGRGLVAWLRHADRLVLAGLALALHSVAAQALNWGGPTGTQLVALVTNAGFTAAIAVGLWRLSRVPGLPDVPRRFWATLAVAVALFMMGQVIDLGMFVAHVMFGMRRMLPGQQFIYPFADAVTILALVRYPVDERARAERLRLWLDVVIVTLAAGTFFWYFSIGARLDRLASPLELIPDLVQPLAALVFVVLLAKAILAGTAVMDRRALLPFGAAALVSGLPPALEPFVSAAAYPRVANSIFTGVELCGVLGAVLQYRAMVDGTALLPRQRRRRPYSLLPYAAGAAAFALLLHVVTPTLTLRGLGVAAGAVALGGWSSHANWPPCTRTPACWMTTARLPPAWPSWSSGWSTRRSTTG
jgi:hypothetical protein